MMAVTLDPVKKRQIAKAIVKIASAVKEKKQPPLPFVWLNTDGELVPHPADTAIRVDVLPRDIHREGVSLKWFDPTPRPNDVAEEGEEEALLNHCYGRAVRSAELLLPDEIVIVFPRTRAFLADILYQNLFSESEDSEYEQGVRFALQESIHTFLWDANLFVLEEIKANSTIAFLRFIEEAKKASAHRLKVYFSHARYLAGRIEGFKIAYQLASAELMQML